MDKKLKNLIIFLFLALIASLLIGYLKSVNIPVLQPKGTIAQQELHLIYISLLLSLFVVIPVFTMTFMIVWKYRESNKSAKYRPNWDGNKLMEIIWWLIPTALIFILAGIIWTSSYNLDPHKPLTSTQKPINIQVVALDWKWLFIYPDEHIASVNYLQIPKNTPVKFSITADAPMNSFWIPQLGGQIYAMPGMSTNLNLMANQEGKYYGSSANISGRGFSGMNFYAKASNMNDYKDWVDSVQGCANKLTLAQYSKLAKPSQNNKIAFYSQPKNGLYDEIMMKYMMPMSQDSSNPVRHDNMQMPSMHGMHDMEGMMN